MQRSIQAIKNELDYQKLKWGEGKEQSLAGYLILIEEELNEAKLAWIKNHTNPRQTCLEEITQIAALCISCLEKYGTIGSAKATDDEKC